MLRKLLIAVCLGLFLSNHCLASNDFSKGLKKLFGKQFKNYQWLDYPLDNFGIGSMASTTSQSKSAVEDFRDRFLCDTFNCLEISPVPSSVLPGTVNPNPQWFELIKDGVPYASVGCGGELKLDKFTRKSKTAIKVLLPSFLKAVGIDISYSNDKSITINGSASSLCDRRILTARFANFLKDNTPGIIGSAYADGDLILVKNDVVIQSIEFNVTSGSKLGSEINTALGGETSKVFGANSKVSVEFSREKSGDYKIRSTKPLIIGVYAVRQPREKSGFSSTAVEDWNRLVLKFDPEN